MFSDIDRKGEIMIKPIGPQYVAAKKTQRVGLTHVSAVVERLMRIYGLEDEMIEQQELEADKMQTAEFDIEPTAIPASVSVSTDAQSTFAWFE